MPLQILYMLFFLILVVVTVWDLRQRRIPNMCTLAIVALALIGHSLSAGIPGLIFSLKGLSFGFALLIFPYLLGGLGAGDVKLMAAVGAVLGWKATFVAFLFIGAIGGLVSVVMMGLQGVLWPTLRNVAVMVYGLASGAGWTSFKVNRAAIGRSGVPYGAVITVGTGLFFVWHWYIRQGWPTPQL